ncbi:MAG: SusC/RagA family TonB-linked outer membrane protein [Gemmatimonadetes bacterium]|nr:SusC/RagA family TonB-linked outer membrane protein [Gemmatimonadota bacterium]
MRYRSVLSALALLFLALGSASAQTRIVTGRVTDSLTNEVITSGQVSVQGTTTGTTIADDGTFTIAVPMRDVVLQVRSIGFKRKDVAVPTSQNAVNASLARDYFQLEAIVVTGQATGVERKNLANAVATVSADQLVKAPTASVEQSLQGKMAGADINQNNGAPGGGNIVRMRGVTSIIGSFQPLYVVDGVIVSNAEIGRGTNLIQRAYTGPGIVPTTDNQDNAVNRIADLNPNDIESVEVLKGAAASAIYGSKASNGVILITTKRGRTGGAQYSLVQRVGASKISNTYGTRCYASAAEATAVFGVQGGTDFASGVCHDFEDELYGKPAYATETSVSVSGGSENTRYFSSALVKHDGGISPRTYADKQSLRLNLDQNIGSRIQVAWSGDIIHVANDRGLFNNENNGSPSQAALSSMPSFIDYRGVCPDGSRVENPGKPCTGATYPRTSPYAFSNPFESVGRVSNKESVWRSIFTTRVNFDLISSAQNTLRITGNGGGDIFTQKNQVISPPDVQFEALDGKLGSSAIGFGQSQQFNVNGNIVYTFKTSSGMSATTQAGIQYETNDLDRDNTLTENLIGGQTNQGLGTVVTVQQYRERIRDLGFFGQEELLLFNERLLLTAGLRADKSSNNSDPKKLSYYPKGAASYRLPVSGFLSELKVRAAMGQSGNRPSYGQKFTALNGANINGLPISTVSNTAAASDLRPERQTELEGGLDATLFGGRANLEVTVYQKGIKDLLLTRTLTPTAGFTTLVYNGVFKDSTGAEQTTRIRNKGLELALTILPVQTPSFQWNARGTFFRNKCTVLSTPATFRPISFFNFNQFGTTQIEKDSSCTQIYANDSLGRYGPSDTKRPNGTTGVIGEVVNRRIGDNAPDWRFGLSNEFTFKRFRLYALVEHQQGGLIVNFSRYTYDAVGNSADQKVDAGFGLTGDQRVNTANNKTALGTATHPATYTKLREASIGYDLPTSFTRKIWSGARYIRLNVTGRNLMTWSEYKKVGYDPEVQQVARSLAVESTWELWAYPSSRSVYFTVDLGF